MSAMTTAARSRAAGVRALSRTWSTSSSATFSSFGGAPEEVPGEFDPGGC
jgi:hypothetical protein